MVAFNNLTLDYNTSLNAMTAADRLYQLIQILPESQVTEVLHFAEFLYQRERIDFPSNISPGILTGLRGIAKGVGRSPSDEGLQADYADYLAQKYQSASM